MKPLEINIANLSSAAREFDSGMFLTGDGSENRRAANVSVQPYPTRPSGMSVPQWAMVQERQSIMSRIGGYRSSVEDLKVEIKQRARRCDEKAMELSRMEADLEEINRWLAANGVTQ